MKTFKSLLILTAVVAVLLSGTQAMAQFAIFFDEAGNSGGSFGPLPSGVGVDPASGTATLFYLLPFAITPGDLQMTEPPTGVSDLVRFTNNPQTGTGQIFFYSDNGQTSDPADGPADVGLPAVGPNLVVQPEQGPEGNNGLVWQPGGGQPGFAPTLPGQLTYQIESDVVPEPSSFLLAGLAGALAICYRRRK